MKIKSKSFLTKLALAAVCVFAFTAGFLTLGLNNNSQTAFAVTGSQITTSNFATTEGKWNDKKTTNLITTPTLPSYNTGDGKDLSKWKSFWDNKMVPSGWGSDKISGDDNELQVYATTALDGSDTFAIRPAKSGTYWGGDACLGGAGADTVEERYEGGVSYTIQLSVADQAIANSGYLKTSAKAEIYMQKLIVCYASIKVEFYKADGSLITQERNVWHSGVFDNRYTSRSVSGITVPQETVYIRYWFSNNSVGNVRKAVKNMQAYLQDNTPVATKAHDGITFTAWDKNDSLPTSGNYFLTKDVSLTSAWVPTGDVNLCLSGYKIIQTADSETVNVASGVTLNIYDCTESGEITHASGKVGKGIESSGTVNFYSGKITGNGGESMTSRGGGVLVIGGIFNMHGGEISFNKLGSARGAGVAVGNTQDNNQDATFNMYGGEIFGNTVTAARGSAVSIGGETTGGNTLLYFNMFGGRIYANTTSGSTATENLGQADAVVLSKNGRFDMSAGEITENRNGVYVEAGVLNLSGTAFIDGNGSVVDKEKGGTYGHNVRLGIPVTDVSTDDRYITIKSALTEGARIGVSIMNGHGDKISSGNKYSNNPDSASTDTLNYMYSEDSSKRFYYDSTDKCIKMDNGHNHGETEYSIWQTTNGDFSDNGNFYLNANLTATANITVKSGQAVTLCLNGHTLDMGAYSIIIENGAKFDMCDCQESPYKESGEITGSGGAVIENNGEFSMDGGDVNNTNSNSGDALKNNSGGKFNMASGNINSSSGSPIANNGGTVQAEEGVSISSGEGDNVVEEIPPHVHEFEDNNCYCGAHTHDDGTTLLTEWTATSGNITESGKYYLGDTIPAVSGYISIASGVEVTLCLNGNTLDLGNYYIVNSGTLTICDCQGTGKIVNSGSYLINNLKEFNLYSGTIENSVSATYGVLYSKGSTANANIYGGTINGYVKAINNVSGSTLNVTGGTISSTSSYAINNNGDSNNISTAEISGGTISGTAGVASSNDYTSISISGNPIITGSSTGVIVQGENVVSGGTITGGTGNGVQNSGTLTISGGTISSSNSIGVRNFAQLTVAGGKITGKDFGIYNEYSTSSLTVTDGEITATNGSGISAHYGITVEISGGTISGSTYGVIINHADMNLYLSSNPTITGRTADVYYQYNGLVYAHSADGTTAYNGQSLTLDYYSYSDSVVAVCNVTNDNINKFTLVNSDYGLLLGGEDTPQDDLVLHKHAYSTVNYDNDTHWNECSCGSVDSTSVKTHSIVNADIDCTTDEKCSCGKVMVAKNASHTYAYSASDNVITETCSVEGCTVHTATATIVKPEGTLTYNGNEFNATVTYSDKWAGSKDLEISYTRDGDIISAGKITASITISDKTANVTYTIEKANQTAPSGVGKVDTSYIDTTDGKITGVTNAMEYKLSTESDYIAISGTEITNLASGTYFVRFAENDNYNASEYVSVTINKGGKRTATITNVSDVGKTYNGTAVSNPTYTYGGDGQIAITWYADNSGVKGNALASAPINAGTYWVGVKAIESANYNAVSEVTKKFTISKATYDMSGITFVDGQFTYDGNAHSLVISGTLPTGVNVAYSANNAQTNATTEPITVTATFTGDITNYNAIPNKTATITINPKNISGANITLGSALTYTGKEQTQTVTSVVIDGLTVTYDISGNKQTNVGASDYILTVTGKGNFTGTANRAWNIAKAQAVISVDTTPIVKTYGDIWELPQATSNFGTVECDKVIGDLVNANTYTVTYTVAGTSNYNGDVKTINVTINAKSITVKADDKTITYGDADVELTYTATGLVGNDALADIELVREEGTNADSYTIMANAIATANPNYAITFEDGTYEISKKDISLAIVTLGNTLIENGSAQTQEIASVVLEGYEITYEVSGNVQTNAGEYELTVLGTGNFTGSIVKKYVVIKNVSTAPEVDENDIGAGTTEIGDGSIVVDVKKEEGAPEIKLESSKTELIGSTLTAEELSDVSNGADIEIWIEVKDANEVISEESKSAIETATSDYTVGLYVDISMFKKLSTENEATAITSTDRMVKISLEVPTELIKSDTRTYYIVRNHDGEVEILDTVYDATTNTLTFETDRFSDYAIVYEDTCTICHERALFIGNLCWVAWLLIFLGIVVVVGGATTAAVIIIKKKKGLQSSQKIDKKS